MSRHHFAPANVRYHCPVCKCWLENRPNSIRMHEQGQGHVKLLQEKLVKQRQQRALSELEEKRKSDEIERINAQALQRVGITAVHAADARKSQQPANHALCHRFLRV